MFQSPREMKAVETHWTYDLLVEDEAFLVMTIRSDNVSTKDGFASTIDTNASGCLPSRDRAGDGP